MTVTLYGIPNCDTVKKARTWLNAHNIEHEFIDFKKAMPTPETLARWHQTIGPDTLINRRGTTWRKLSDAQKSLTSESDLVALMHENSSIIKRPVLAYDDQLHVGFTSDGYSALFHV